MASKTVQFNVEMHCQGCAKAVRSALTKVTGVTNVDINLEKQTVTVDGTAPSDTLLQAIQKTGKKVSQA